MAVETQVFSEGRSKPWFSSGVRQWLLSLGEVFVEWREWLSAKPVIVRRSANGYLLSTGKPAIDGNVARYAADLAQVREQLTAARRSKSPVIIRLSDDEILCCDRSFPKAVADVIQPVLRNQIQKMVPWPEDDVTFAFSVIGSTPIDNEILTRVAITKQSLINQLKEHALSEGLNLDAIDCLPDGATSGSIALYDTILQKRELMATRIGRIMIGACLISLAVASIGYFEFARRQWAVSKVEQSIASQRTQLAAALSAKQERSQSAEQINALVSSKRDQLSRIAIIDQLSRQLPDRTWLDSLEIRNDVVVITGFSDNAADIVRLLEKASDFTDVKFTAATERSRFADREKFQITTRLAVATREAGQ